MARKTAQAKWDKDAPLDSLSTSEGKIIETAKHSQALRDYAMLGPARSLIKLLHRYTAYAPDGPKPPTTSIDTLKTWSAQFDWQSRIAAWDLQEAERDMLEWEQRRRELRERDWNEGNDLRDKVQTFIEQLPRFTRTQIAETESTEQDAQGNDVKVITRIVTVKLNANLTQLARALERASKLQRLATDLPTANVQLSGAALDAAIDRELAALASVPKGA